MQTRKRKRASSRTTECPICLEPFTKEDLSFAFGCIHGVCHSCDNALKNRGDLRCPTCRTPRNGVSSADAEAAAVRIAPVPDHAAGGDGAMIYFPIHAEFTLTNELLFGGAAEVVPASFEPPSAMRYGRRPGSRQRQAQAQRQAQRQATPQVIGRALLLAQAAASALTDPSLSDSDFAATIAAALADEN